MFEVQVASATVRRDEFTKEGETKVRWKQQVAINVGGDFQLPFEVEVKSQDSGYPVGEYYLAPECFRVSRFGSIEINSFSVRLVPIQQSKLKAAS